MVKDGAARVAPYGFHPAFERAVVFFACTDAQFYGTVGHALEAPALASEQGKMALEAAHAVARDLGHGPASSLLVLQRLSRWRSDGKITHDQVAAVDDLLTEAEGAVGRTPVSSVIEELVPLVRQRMYDAATRRMINASSTGDAAAVGDVEDKLTAARALGKVDTSLGTRVSVVSYDEIMAARYMDRLPFGIDDLDVALEGGVPRGTLSVALGDQKSGKSMLCSHLMSSTMLRRQLCCYASLENPRHVVLARVKANLTGVPINTLLNGDVAQSAAILEEMQPRMGPGYVKSFVAKATTVQDVFKWMDSVEDSEGRRCDLLVVDYLDKLRPPRAADRDGSSYAGTGVVFESARVRAEQRGMWVFSPTQSTGRSDARGRGGRGGKGGKGSAGTPENVLDMGDEADSVEKSRVADLFLTMNPRDEGRSILFYVAGYRHGESRKCAGPVPVDFALGRFGNVVVQSSPADEW